MTPEELKALLEKHGKDLQAFEDAYKKAIEAKADTSELEKIKASLDAAQKEIVDLNKEMSSMLQHGVLAALEGARVDEGKPVYSNIGEQLIDIADFAQNKATETQINKIHTVQAAASGANTSVSSEGGFLVQTDFTTMLLDLAMAQSEVASRCTTMEIGADSDSLEAPYVEETSRATGSRFGGVRVYRRAEAATVTASKPGIGKWECALEDLMAICYATGRSLRDASAMSSIIKSAFPAEASFVIDDEIIRGTGAGQCQGITVAPCLVSQAKETGQAADTLLFENIIKMWARMPAKLRRDAVWFINQELEPQLDQMYMAVGTGGIPVYMPANGVADSPYGRLKGRPVIPIEQCSAPGDVGDIILANMKEYVVIRKDGLQADESMHVRFLYDEMAFRFIWRVNGRPKWKSALTPYKGSNTLSPFVTLAAR